jgi:hypothetical protein
MGSLVEMEIAGLFFCVAAGWLWAAEKNLISLSISLSIGRPLPLVIGYNIIQPYIPKTMEISQTSFKYLSALAASLDSC